TFHNGDQGNTDWIGYLFPAVHEFHALIYQDGVHQNDGGFWNLIRVQYSQDGVNWYNASGLVVTHTYAGGTAPSYATYSMSFTPVTALAIRLQGTPGGSSRYVRVGELRVLALEPTPAHGRSDV